MSDTVDDPTRYGTVTSPEQPLDSAGEPPAAPAPEPDLAGEPTAATTAWDELPDPAWQSDATRQRRRWLLLGLATAAGVFLAIAVFVYLVGRNPAVVSPSPELTQAGAGDSVESPPAEPGSLGSTTSPGTTPVELDPLAPEPVLPEPVGAPPAAPGPDSSGELPSPLDSGVSPTPPRKTDEPAPTTPPPGTNLPEPPLPPDLAPPPGTPDIAKADRMTPGGGLAETLRRLGGLLDDSGESESGESAAATPGTGEPPAAPPADDPAGTDPATAEVAKTARPAPRIVDLAARLADPIQEIQFNVPLQDFLHFVTTYSTIPITLDPDVLVYLKLTPDTPVDVQLKETTVDAVLNTVLPKLGLQAVPVDNQLLVTRATIGDGGLRTARRPVDDLLKDDPSHSELLLTWVQELIAPRTWAGSGGEGTASVADGWLELRQADAVVLEVSVFLERLRVARGLPKKSSFDDRMFQPISRTARANSLLSRKVTVNYPRPTPFTRIVRRLATETSSAILVNWQALERAGWNPDAETTLAANDQPMGEALNSLLQPMDLVYRVVDETTLQVTTAEDLEARQEVEYYPVGPLLDGGPNADGLQQRIRDSLPPEFFAGGDGALAFDPVSRCLLALLSQPQHQVLEKLLLSWKPTDK